MTSKRPIHSYTVSLQTVPLAAFDDEAPDRVFTALERDKRIAGPVVESSSVTKTVGATVSIDSVAPAAAVMLASIAFGLALTRAGLKGGELRQVSVELDSDDDLARDEIVGAAEVARRIGVSRERIRQLAGDPKRFPVAVANVRGSRAWRWGDIADWITAGGRRGAGRPRKDPDNTIDLLSALKVSVTKAQPRKRAG